MNENVLSEEILVSYEFHNNFFLLLYLKVSLSIPIMSKYVVMVLLKSLFWYILLQWFVTMKYIWMVPKKNTLVMPLQFFHSNTFYIFHSMK